MDELELRVNLFAPRRNRDENFIFNFRNNGLSIRLAVMNEGATWVSAENGLVLTDGNLTSIMGNDNISAPWNLDYLVERLWYDWKDDTFSTPEELQRELNALAEYINTCSRARPATNFWSEYFN